MTVSLNEAAQLNPDSQCAGGDKTALPLLGTNYNYNRRRAFLPCLKARGLQPEDFDDYLKERGISEEVSALAKQRWEVLRAETSNGQEKTTDVPDSPPSHFKRFLHRLRHHINHLFS